MNGPSRMMVDWSRVMEETRREGYTLTEIAQFTAISRSNLTTYQYHGMEPRHWYGVQLLRLWAQVTGKSAEDPPLIPRPLTAADFR